MCGISGFVHKNPLQPVDLTTLRKMTDILRHRGPDGEGFYLGPGAGLGFRRLSIIDLESGDQPLSDENETLHLICNGEIYNYIELRNHLKQKGHIFKTRSDAEVIIHLYEEYGTRCLSRLRGMFAFALWDSTREQLFLARDRLGIKPLHYAFGVGRTLYFSSEQKSILTAGCIQRDANPRAFEDLFTFGFILSPNTLFQHIHILPPGHFAVYKHGTLRLKSYWDLSFPGNGVRKHLSENAWAEKLHEKFKEVVKLHLRSDVPVSSWLSAGIDSSAVTALMSGLTGHPVHTFSLTFPDHPDFDEITGQKTLDQFPKFRITNEQVPVGEKDFNFFLKSMWHHEDPTSSGNHAIRMLLARASARNFKVVLTGEGADEIFGGYPWYLFNTLFRPIAVLPESLRRLMLEATGMMKDRPWFSSVFLAPRNMNLNRYARLLGSFGDENIMDNVFSKHWRCQVLTDSNNYESLHYVRAFSQWHDIEKLQFMEIRTRLTDYIVRGLDRGSMAYSLEARVPFLDHELVELCAQIPPALKIKRLKEKYIFRKAMSADLPPEIRRRKKRGLIAPGGPWLKGSLPEFVKYFFSETQLRKKGYFNPAYVRQLLNRHRSGKMNLSRALMVILNTQIWDELFVQGCK